MAFSSWRTWVTGEVVTAAHMNQEVRDNGLALWPDGATGVSWSPTLQGSGANPGTSAVAGVEYTMGVIQFCWVRWVLSSGGSGTYSVTLPSTATGITASAAGAAGQIIGNWMARDDSVPSSAAGSVLLTTTTTAQFNVQGLFTGAGVGGFLADNQPWVWGTGDVLDLYIQYPIA